MLHQSPPLENLSSSFGATKRIGMGKVLEDINNIESIGNVHNSKEVDLVRIITNLLNNVKRKNFLILDLVVSSH